jgi:predicted RNase H-like HicB family nuclease
LGGAKNGRQSSDEAVVMKYKIALQSSEEGYSVSGPGLPGCWSQGASEEEAIANIQDAIREYLAAVTELTKDAVVREIDVPL